MIPMLRTLSRFMLSALLACSPPAEAADPTTTAIIALSDALADGATMGGLSLGTSVLTRRGSELELLPLDPRHAEVIVELEGPDDRTARVKGVRVRLAQHQSVRWPPLEERFGPFKDEAELTGRPSTPPARVATAHPAHSPPQTIRVSVDEHGDIVSFVVREHHW